MLDFNAITNTTGIPTGGNLFVSLYDVNLGIPTTGNSSSIRKDEYWEVSDSGSLTRNGVVLNLEPGDKIQALIDNPTSWDDFLIINGEDTEPVTFSVVTQAVTAGHKIADHDNGQTPGILTDILETVTTVTGITNGYQLKNEDGSTNDLTFEFNNTTPSNPLLEVKLDGNIQSSIPLNSYDVNIQTTGGLTFNATTDEITITETDGEIHVLDLTPLRTTVTSIDTSVEIVQSTNTDGSINYDLSTSKGSLTFSASPAVFPTTPIDNDTHLVTDNGTNTGVTEEMWKYDEDTSTWVEIVLGDSCTLPMTRAALRALRTAGGLNPQCHYTITNPSVDGNLDVQEIQLHAVNENTLSMNASILTSHDVLAWDGVYDIDADNVLEVTDNLENKVISNASILNFPFGITAVNGNTVENRANVIYTSGNFSNNQVGTDATVTTSGTQVNRNHFEASSNTTINSGDFRENRVEGDATVTSSTTGDIDNCKFSANSNSTISGTANIDTSEIKTDANLTMTGGTVVNCEFKALSGFVMSGGILRESVIGEDADVTIISGDNYENNFGNSTVYNQVGTGYIRYSNINGTTTWTNGNTNVSNVTSHVSTINTTGSTGTISNSNFTRVYGINMQNVASLTVTDSTLANYSTLTINNAARFYFYRSTCTDASRILISAGARIDASYTNVSSYGYLQATQGFLRANYCNVSSVGYIRNQSPGTNYAERCQVSGQASVRFDGTVDNCRVYYSTSFSGGAIYHSGTSTGCYIYYSSTSGNGQIYTTNSTNGRMYYNSATARGYVRSTGNTVTHYMYYCSATASGYVDAINNNAGIRMYAVNASAQSIARVQNSTAAGRFYYSDFDSYYYALFTFTTTGTRSGYFGKGRLSKTVTNPVKATINTTGQYLDNIA